MEKKYNPKTSYSHAREWRCTAATRRPGIRRKKYKSLVYDRFLLLFFVRSRFFFLKKLFSVVRRVIIGRLS